MTFTGGTFPVYNSVAKVGTKGSASVDTDMKTIAELESCEIKVAGKTEDWTSMTSAGWGSTMMTGKTMSVTCKAKRCIGDIGNDYVSSTAYKDGLDCNSKFSITFPDGGILSFDCVLDVTNPGSGESSAAAALEFEAKCSGKPTYTAGTGA
ncbi:MAG: phiCP51 [Anaerocolumna sp.]|jgi:hypothetical protein|nr:phiCP51 [Anaerocolumna sp.]